MDVTDGKLFEVLDQSQVSEARRGVIAMAAELGLPQKKLDDLALVATELGTNLIKHTTHGGVFIAQGLASGNNIGIELFACDKGGGMEIAECVKDGYSTAGSLGTGLGAIKRLCNSFEVWSSMGQGTVIQTRMWTEKTSSVEPLIGGLTVPLKGEQMSGDKWTVCEFEGGLYCMLIDGLGHGFEAAEASKLAVKRFKENLSLQPAEMLKTIHTSLRGTRGAVGAVARIDENNATMTYAGLGNVVGVLLNDSEQKHLVSLNGTLGYEARKVTEFKFPWSTGSTLMMHSDGLPTKSADDLNYFRNVSASLMAASLLFFRTKKTDDATVLVVNN